MCEENLKLTNHYSECPSVAVFVSVCIFACSRSQARERLCRLRHRLASTGRPGAFMWRLLNAQRSVRWMLICGHISVIDFGVRLGLEHNNHNITETE